MRCRPLLASNSAPMLNLGPKRIATAQLARIDPTFLAEVGEDNAEFAHEQVVNPSP